MCLTFEFWEYANKEAKKYEDKGYKFLEGVLEEYNLTEEVLYNLGWVQVKQECTTADLYYYELTEKGKKYLIYKRRSQLFIFKKNRFEEAFEMLSTYESNKIT